MKLVNMHRSVGKYSLNSWLYGRTIEFMILPILASFITGCGQPMLTPDPFTHTSTPPSFSTSDPMSDQENPSVANYYPAQISTETLPSTPTMTNTTTLSLTPHPNNQDMEEPPDRDLFDLARRLLPNIDHSILANRIRNSTSYELGHTQTFFVTDPTDGSTSEISAKLEFLTENAYWYVDNSLRISSEALRSVASKFERNVYPVLKSYIGDVAHSDINSDSRITILNTRLQGVAGYYGSNDLVSSAIHPYSNELEIVYADARLMHNHPDIYLSVLAHELQHLLHALIDPGEETWINEGLSEVVSGIAGFPPSFINSFLKNPTTQLNYWADELDATSPHYGGSTLFVEYLAEHYGGYESLKSIVNEPLDGTKGVDKYLSQYGVNFLYVFKNWIVANYLGAPEGPYGYGEHVYHVQNVEIMDQYGKKMGTLPQFAAKYIQLNIDDGSAILSFQGSPDVAQISGQCHSDHHCWWSNQGDSINSTLTREFDLSLTTNAHLEFWIWFEIEDGWDYGYVEVSDDGGSTWTILEGLNTTQEDPAGNSYGSGFTGHSNGWLYERIDLTPYVGGKVLVRFEYVTDDSVFLDGLTIDDITISEINFFDDVETPSNWMHRGFTRIDNILNQRYFIQVVERYMNGDDIVREMYLDENKTGQMTLQGFGSDILEVVVIIAAATFNTQERASYVLTVTSATDGGIQQK